MADTKEKLLPGTATTYIDRGEKGFSKIEMLLEATGGLSLSQVCAVTGLEGSTIQNWVKRGWVAHPKGKRYEEIHIARILIINALKECIKLEHIALLMSYINGPAEDTSQTIIKESELFNFLCEALDRMGQPDNGSRGVEAVVETVIKDYQGPTADAQIRIRKSLSLMIYACVCTDVKRRTEAMMDQILYELEHPEKIEPETEEKSQPEQQASSVKEAEPEDAPRKTVIQAIREWDANDISSVERVIIDYNDERTTKPADDSAGKQSYRPWYLRKGPKR
jgi:hypothetical protein